MNISIIIPVYNEEENLPKLLPYLLQNSDSRLLEILVVDGRSSDNSVLVATQAGADKVLSSPQRGRAAQMNVGARHAQGDILYFIHADTIPPESFLDDIAQALEEGYPMGCYRYQFDSPSKILKVNAYCTRFDRLMCRGGDQTLFIKKELFDSLRGFDPAFLIMEEYDFLIRARKIAPFIIIPKDAIVSARKYIHNSYFRVNLSNLIVFIMFFLGCSQKLMLGTYKKLLRYK